MTPAIPLFFAAAAGALWGSHGRFGLVLPLVLAGISAAIVVAANQDGVVKAVRLAALVALAGALAASVATFERQTYRATVGQLPLSTGPVVLEGIAKDVAPARTGGLTLLLDVTSYRIQGESVPAAATVMLRVKGAGAAATPRAGDRLLARGTLRPLFPAFSPGTFDAELFGLSRRLHARMGVFDRQSLVVVERNAAPAFFARWRNLLRDKLNALVTPREAGVLLALIVGDTAQFDREQLDLYRSVGAGHLLAVSGLQVSLLAYFVFVVLRFLFAALPWTGRRGWARPLATLGALLSVAAFVLLCGAPPSCVRAGVMAGAVFVAALVGRRARALDALGLGGLCTVLLSPTSVIDPSFLLSYAAVLGLIAVGAPADAGDDDEGAVSDADADLARAARARRLQQAFAVVASAFAAGVVTLPISAHLFGELSLGGILANVVLVPVASALQVPAIALGLLGAFFSSPVLAELGAASAGLLEAITEGLSQWVGGVVAVPAPSGLQAAGLTAAAVCLAVFFGRPHRRLGYLAAAAGLALLVLLPSTITPSGVRMTVLPVGQGDGTVVEMEDGRVLVIDGGGVWDERVHPGEKVVLPFLRRRGIDRVHAVVLSHPDPDHLLGLLDVMREVPVDQLWHSGFDRGHPLMRRLLDLAQEQKVTVKTARDLAPVQTFGQTQVQILTPFPEDGSALYDELSPNENSLTLRFVHGQDSALWPGDLEEWGERYLLRDGAPVASTVIKAGHHGSRTSSTPAFVDAVSPKIVIFPTGADNQWGFPHPEVVQRWKATGARLYDTAQHGETVLFLTGEGVVVQPFRWPTSGPDWARE